MIKAYPGINSLDSVLQMVDGITDKGAAQELDHTPLCNRGEIMQTHGNNP